MNGAGGQAHAEAVLTAADVGWAVAIAVLLSLMVACVEIPRKSKVNFRACLVLASFVYWTILAFGNTVATLLATTLVIKLPASLSPYYFLMSAFLGVFAFEAILKNTNVTLFNKGVLTIQTWIDHASDSAAAAAIVRREELMHAAQEQLVARLMKKSHREINTLVLNKMGPGTVETLDTAAAASAADPKLYKVYQVIMKMPASERTALLRDPSV